MHRVDFIYNGKWVTRHPPEKWGELTLDQLLSFCKIMLSDLTPVKKRSALALSFLGVKSRNKLVMNNAELMDIIKLQDFLFDTEADLTRFLTGSLSIKTILGFSKTYHSPGDNLKHSTVGEVAFADSYLQRYILNKKDEDLCRLIAAIYRPSNLYRKFRHRLHGGDIRVTFNDNMARKRAEKFKFLPEYLKLAILYQFKGCRTMDVRNNPELYEGKDEAAASPFGWAGVIINMAGPEIGTIDQVENMLWSNAIVFLKKIEFDRKQMEEKFRTNNHTI